MGTAMKRGWTIVELLVVIAIIMLLVALLFPLMTQAREIAKRVVCLSNLRNIALGAQAYGQDSSGYIPVTANQPDDDLRLYFPDYVPELRVFVCPSTLNYVDKRADLAGNAASKGRARGTSYEYWAWCCGAYFMPGPFHRRRLSDESPEVMTILADIDDRVRNLLLDPPDNHGVKGGNALFLDLHAVWVEVTREDPLTWNAVQAGWVDAYLHGGAGVKPKP